jgi:hypothetical protein
LRQKLARFNTNEFAGLLLEILKESKRRYYNTQSSESSKKSSLNRKLNKLQQPQDDILEDDDPLYDKVPSDEDYASVASESSSIFESIKMKPNSNKQNEDSSERKNGISSPLTLSLSSSPINHASAISKSNKNTPSPSKFVSKEHKVLLTNFDKPPAYFNQQQQLPPPTTTQANQQTQSNNQQSSLVANAESALNSIINSLNQIDYSHLNPNQSQSTMHESKLSDLNNIDNSSQSTNKVILSELKNENELMQAMVNFYSLIFIYFSSCLIDISKFYFEKIERLMEENAQLRAEKMLLAATATVESNQLPIQMSNSKTTDEINLYSTVKNKKFNNFKEKYLLNNNIIEPSNINGFVTKSNGVNGNSKKKQTQLANSELFYVPMQQMTKSSNINYNLKEDINENDRFNFEQ